MFKKLGAAVLSSFLGLALVAQPALARFDLHFASDIVASNGGTAYEWYMPDLEFRFDLESRDGTMPTGEPYSLFKGNDASPNGHCLEISFRPGQSPPPWMQVKVRDHGTYRLVTIANLLNGGYPTMRLWVHRNTASGTLPWALYFEPDDLNVDFSGDINVDVRRLEVSKAGCTTAQVGGAHDPALNAFPWVAFEGNSSSYTVTKGNF